MATSGSYDYSVTATTVVTEALESIGVLAVGETVSADDLSSCMRTLNMMVKQWSGNFDFAPGLKAFNRKHGFVFLQKNQGSYSIGPSGDNASLSYISTTMRVAAIATATTLEITSSTDMTAADYIGIELDSGSIYWTTISSVTDGDTIVIPASGLTGAVAAGNRIFSYTTKLIRPLYIEDAVLRDTSGNDSTIYPMTTQYYENLSVKGTDSVPSYYKYDNTLTNGTIYFDVEPSDVTSVARITFMAPAEDYDSQTNDIAYPQEWYTPISLGLGKLVAPKFNVPWTELLESNYNAALAMARSSYAETTDLYFQPGLE
jgi:hypothetical protein